MSYEEKAKGLGLEIPTPLSQTTSYVPAVEVEKYVYTSGQIPFVEGELKYQGRVGEDFDEKEAYEAAKICILNCLSVIKGVVGSIDSIERIIKLRAYFACSDDFELEPKLLNGASEILGEIFGDKGQHARTVLGVSKLPLNAACEIELLIKVK